MWPAVSKRRRNLSANPKSAGSRLSLRRAYHEPKQRPTTIPRNTPSSAESEAPFPAWPTPICSVADNGTDLLRASTGTPVVITQRAARDLFAAGGACRGIECAIKCSWRCWCCWRSWRLRGEENVSSGSRAIAALGHRVRGASPAASGGAADEERGAEWGERVPDFALGDADGSAGFQ